MGAKRGVLDQGQAFEVKGHIVRELVSSKVLAAISEMGAGVGRAKLIGHLEPNDHGAIVDELADIANWSEEYWILDHDDSVVKVTEQEFNTTEPNLRFSHSDSLRRASEDATATKALMSAVRSDTVAQHFSEAFGRKVEFRSADVARYRSGHYLRRHADTYEDRVFGLLFFLSSGWSAGCGGELIAESPSGEVDVVPPLTGRIGVLPIRPNYWHLVSRVKSADWVRYSVAAHFSTTDEN